MGLANGRVFSPGENWDYSHTNILILGLVMEAVTGQSLEEIISERVIQPLGLQHTFTETGPFMRQPILHAYTSERRSLLQVDSSARFYEDSTHWNPSWTLSEGAIQYSTVGDMASSFSQIAQGALLSHDAYKQLVDDSLIGFGSPLEGCPSCHELDTIYSYGMGIVQSNTWLMQNPSFGGYGSTVATHPDANITIAAAVTFSEEAFDEWGDYANGNSSQSIVRACSEVLLPDTPVLRG